MLYSTLIGLLLSLVTIGIHGLGTISWIRHLTRKVNSVEAARRRQLLWQLRLLSFSAGFLLILHIIEIAVWATVYLFLVKGPPMNGLEDAVYFSTVTFTSLGYGDVVLQAPWRLIGAIQAMTGILAFGWSTALLFAVVQRIWLADAVTSDPDNQ